MIANTFDGQELMAFEVRLLAETTPDHSLIRLDYSSSSGSNKSSSLITPQKMHREAPLKILAQEFVVIFVGNRDELGWEKFFQCDTLRKVLKDDDSVTVLRK